MSEPASPTAGVTLAGISDRMGDNGPPALDGMDANGNPISGMCAGVADVAACDAERTVAPEMRSGLMNISNVTAVAALAATLTGFEPAAAVFGGISITTGAVVTVSDCLTGSQECLLGGVETGIGISPAALGRLNDGRFSISQLKDFDVGSQILDLILTFAH